MDDRLAFLRPVTPPTCLPVQCTFEHRGASQGQVALHYWPRKDHGSSCPEHLILFVLGNPGLLDYYIPFLSHLRKLLPPDHSIISTSHIGHSPHLPSPVVAMDLPAQLESKLELVQTLCQSLEIWAKEAPQYDRSQRPKISLMGHSVGAWLICEIMKRLEEDVVWSGIVLFPTLGWLSDTWNARTLWPIFRRPVKPLLSLCSPFLRPILPFTTFPPTTLSLLRSSSVIRHALDLSVSEMNTITEPDMEWFSSQTHVETSRGLFGVWAGGNLDGWVGREGPMIQETLGGETGSRVAVLDGVPHAFCLREDHSMLVAETVAKWIVPTPPTLSPDNNDAAGKGWSQVSNLVPM